MSKYTTEAIRSIALVGHGAAGKTTLAEALLHATGAIASRGSVEKGSTVCDFDAQEKEAGHSLNSAIVNFGYENTHIHLIDTPGYPDFAGPAIAALAGVDTAVLSVEGKTDLRATSGAAAVDMESHVAASFAGRHGVPFAALRVICDPAGQALPAFAAQALTADGEPDIAAVFFAFARGRARLGDLMRLARDSNAAFASLGRCRARLGPGLGIPAAER